MFRRKKSQKNAVVEASNHGNDIAESNAYSPYSTTNPTIPTPSSGATLYKVLTDPDIVERVHIQIKDAHVFKLPKLQSVSVGYRGADWKEKVWQGTIKVVTRGKDHLAIVLIDKNNGDIFAVCPMREGAVERCIDSSRYFVLRIENQQGRHMFIGVAFNERNDAFDFNTALQDAVKDIEHEKNPTLAYTGPTKDYSLKEGQKIRVSIPKISHSDSSSYSTNSARENLFTVAASNNVSGDVEVIPRTNRSSKKRTERKKSSSSSGTGSTGFLKPSSKDTPSRLPN